MRKISIDMNVNIEFETLKITARKESPAEGTYYAIARIHYPESKSTPGLLLYIKPGYLGEGEPASVRSYAAANPVFPHEPTSDQWFGESQFEAYRALGHHIIRTLDGKPDQTYQNIKQFIDAAAARLAKPIAPPAAPVAPQPPQPKLQPSRAPAAGNAAQPDGEVAPQPL